MKVDHIGIAVKSIDASLDFYTKLLGLEHVETEVVATEKVKVAVLLCNGVRVELLEPIYSDSTIAQFLEKKGPGVHHMAYGVDDIEQEVKRLMENNVVVIQPAPRPGAGGCKVAFIHPKSTGGVLVELVERPKNTTHEKT